MKLHTRITIIRTISLFKSLIYSLICMLVEDPHWQTIIAFKLFPNAVIIIKPKDVKNRARQEG